MFRCIQTFQTFRLFFVHSYNTLFSFSSQLPLEKLFQTCFRYSPFSANLHRSQFTVGYHAAHLRQADLQQCRDLLYCQNCIHFTHSSIFCLSNLLAAYRIYRYIIFARQANIPLATDNTRHIGGTAMHSICNSPTKQLEHMSYAMRSYSSVRSTS